MNRRQFLTALGLAPASLWLPASLARAGEAPPKRLVVYLSAQGCTPWFWKCDPYDYGDVAWSDDWTTWEPETFSTSLRPLHRWRHQTTALGGIGMLSAVSEGKDQQHRLSAAHALTGAASVWYTGSALGGGPSVDQVVADHVARPDQLRSLELQVYKGLGLIHRQAIYRDAVYALPAASNPSQVLQRLLGNGAATELRPAFEGALARFDALAPSLSAPDRRILEQHRSMMNDVLVQAEGLSSRSCGLPDDQFRVLEGVQAELDQMMPLITSALACDLTRVITIQSGEPKPSEIQMKSGSVHGSCHAIYSSDEAAADIGAYSAYHAARFADLLDALDSVEEAGGTLLDNTVVLWASELGDGAHGYDDWPVVVAGGRDSGLRLGQYIHYPRANPIHTGRDGERRLMGMPHNRVLVSVARALGLDIDAVGMRTVKAWDGSSIQLTGALPELVS